MRPIDYVRCKEPGNCIIPEMPTVETYHNFDIDVNAIFDRVTGKCDLKFGETDEMCPRCQRDLEVYYCENRTYIVRCKHCHIVTLVQARNPYEAAEKVGLHVKPVRHGEWEDIKGAIRCSECQEKPLYDYHGRLVLTRWCHACGVKMWKEIKSENH